MRKIILPLCFFLLFVGFSVKKNRNYNLETEMIAGVKVKVYKNSGRSSLQSFEIPVKKVFEIKGMADETKSSEGEFVWPRFLDTDSSGSIYIVDRVSASVKKFSKDGRFIKSIGREGSGPGELKNPFMIVILNDILYVTNYAVRRMVTFDSAGNYIEDIILKKQLPYFTHAVGNDRFIGFLRHYEQGKDGVYGGFNLVLMNSGFEKLRILREYSAKIDPKYDDFLDRYTPYTLGKDKIFVAQNSEEVYRINIFSFSGELLYIIEKNYEKVAFNKDELAELNQTFEDVRKRSGGQMARTIKAKFKKAINNMYCDKEGRLLVASSVERNESNRYDFLVDVFQDGVFLKKVKLDIGKGYDFLKIHDEKIFFKGDRIYHVDETAAVVNVFEY